MGTTTVWTHGNALVVEDPGEYDAIRHRGWGTELTYRAPGEDDSARVCHLPLSAPTPVDGFVPELAEVVVLFDAGAAVVVQDVHLWDGGELFHRVHYVTTANPAAGAWTGIGDQRTAGPYNVVAPPRPQVLSAGLGLSLLVGLWPEDALTMTVTSVGAIYLSSAIGRSPQETERLPHGVVARRLP